MIAFPSGVRVWLATGHTDMRKGFGSLAVLVQEALQQDPHGGHVFVFRGKRGDLIKILWHDGQGACLFAKRLERGRFIWPGVVEGRCRSRRRSSATCWKGSIGAHRGRAGGRKRRADDHIRVIAPLGA